MRLVHSGNRVLPTEVEAASSLVPIATRIHIVPFVAVTLLLFGLVAASPALACPAPRHTPPTAGFALNGAAAPAPLALPYGATVSFDAATYSTPGVVTTFTDVWEIGDDGKPHHSCESSDAEDPITAYAWTWGDNSTGASSTGTHTYRSPDTFAVQLTVHTAFFSDDQTAQVTITPPVPAFTVQPTTAWTKTFDAGAATDPLGDAAYSWTFGDNTTGTGALVSHTYTHPSPGYPVTLTVSYHGAFTESTSRAVTILDDNTSPIITIAQPRADVPYLTGQPISADYSCSDPNGSGFVPGAPNACAGTVAPGALIDTTSAGDKQFTVTSLTAAGHMSTTTVTYHVIGTIPVVTVTSPRDGFVYGRGDVVAANFACVEQYQTPTCTGGEGDSPPVANGQPIDTSTLGQHTFTVRGRDPQGNQTIQTVRYQVADVTAPTIAVDTPADSAVFSRDQRVLAAFTCRDETGGSGLASCTATRPVNAALDTATPGKKQFTVVARDLAGNLTTQTVQYTVLDYTSMATNIRLDNRYMGNGAIKIVQLSAIRVERGSRIAYSCRGHGCPRARAPVLVRRSASRLVLRHWKGIVLWPGASLKITVTKPRTIGVVTTYRVRARHAVDKTELCIAPKGRPKACRP